MANNKTPQTPQTTRVLRNSPAQNSTPTAGNTIKILQLNTNRSRPAHDLSLATALDIKADILLISEPNRRAIRERKDWVFDREVDAAIKCISNIPIISRGYGTGFAFIKLAEFTIYSVYSSGNKDIQQFEDTLYEIGSRIRTLTEKAVIGGDFNAKSPQWGMNYTDRRGEVLIEWLAAHDLAIMNRGESPTFQVQGYSSILDLTIATQNLAKNVSKWEVNDRESLSDHNYITYEIVANRKAKPKHQRHHGWQLAKLSPENLENATELFINNNSTTSPQEFSSKLTCICDKSMPKKKSHATRQPVYWWNQDIANLRKESLQRRRLYIRSLKRNLENITEQLWKDYKDSKKNLRDAIKAAKRNSWKELCSNIDTDIWGKGYKIAMKMMNGFPPLPILTIEQMEDAARYLFPVHQELNFNCDRNDNSINFNKEELNIASKKLKSKRSPGPNNIPPEVLKHVAGQKTDYTLSVYNNQATDRKFPAEWKVAKLMLLRKGDSMSNDPASFRPICLLNVEGKLYEQLLLIRLKSELERTGGLSDKQFGFREKRQTVDAVLEITRIAREADAANAQQRMMCAVVTVDVKNAFNSASWQLILEKLERRGINSNLIRIIQSYLSDRTILLEAEDGVREFEVNSGVPQGSVLGPTLWNVLYNDLLQQEYPEGVTLIGFADDIALVATDKNERILMNKINIGLLMVANWMRKNLLDLAPHKTEAVLLTKRRKIPDLTFNLLGNTITPKGSIKYLGIWLDSKLTYTVHVNRIIEKAQRTVTALSMIMPNVGGPRATKRKVLSCVVHSQLLYGAPVWHSAMRNKKICQKLQKIQRQMAIRVTSSYRTISTEAVGVIGGIPPIDLQATERTEKFNGTPKSIARENLIAQWQDRWENGTYGRWTFRLIPNIQRWANRPYGEVDYYLTQALSGHGCFNKYLFDRRRRDTSVCSYCEADEEDAAHTLFVCPRWSDCRRNFQTIMNEDFTEHSMMTKLIESESGWNAVYNVVRLIIETKAKESR